MAFTTSDLAAIDSAIASGELTVRAKDGRTVTLRSMDELLKAREQILAELNTASSTARAYPRHQLASFSDD